MERKFVKTFESFSKTKEERHEERKLEFTEKSDHLQNLDSDEEVEEIKEGE